MIPEPQQFEIEQGKYILEISWEVSQDKKLLPIIDWYINEQKPNEVLVIILGENNGKGQLKTDK